MSTCNQFNLQTLGSQPDYAQKSPRSLMLMCMEKPSHTFKSKKIKIIGAQIHNFNALVCAI